VSKLSARLRRLPLVLLALAPGCASSRPPAAAPALSTGLLVGTTIATPAGAVNVMASGDPEQPPVLFVHGSPGSWDAFAGYLEDAELRARAHLIAFDRPGFGLSSPGRAEPSLALQAAVVTTLLDRLPTGKSAVLVGHSLGGPIAAWAAAERPARVAALVLLAPSLDPALEAPRWYNRLAARRWVERLLPGALVTSNRELMPLADELAELAPRLAGLTLPVVVMQGERDRLVSPRNADYLVHAVRGAPVDVRRLPDLGHLFPFTRRELVKALLLDLLGPRP
jgi:pimeloyl-ACP methyl ester carboxylesterase